MENLKNLSNLVVNNKGQLSEFFKHEEITYVKVYNCIRQERICSILELSFNPKFISAKLKW